MKKWLALLVCALALGLVVAGCGDDDEDEGNGGADTGQQETTAPAETAEETDTAQQGGGTEEVSIGDNFFEPKDVTVSAGTTVMWANEGQAPHTVTKTGGPGEEFDSGNLDPGSDFEQEFTEPGTVDYVCTIHPGQEGTITVE